MKVLLFGVLVDTVGKNVIETTPVKDADALRKYLFDQFPGLHDQRFQIAVNREKVETNVALNDKDEIALLPPFAGG